MLKVRAFRVAVTAAWRFVDAGRWRDATLTYWDTRTGWATFKKFWG